MAANLAGPYQIRIDYLTGGLTHRKNLNCAVIGTPAAGTPDETVLFQTAGDGNVDMRTCVTEYWAFARQFFSSSTSVTLVELWKAVGDDVWDYVTSLGVNLPVGSDTVNPYVPAHQAILTFRSANGGIARDVFMEDVSSSNAQSALVANGAGGAPEQLAAYWMSGACWMLARDDSFPIAPLRFSNGQNERIWRKRYRGA